MRVNAFDLFHIFVRESKLDCADILFDLLCVAGANYCSGHGGIPQNPRNRYLTGRTTVFLTHLSQAFYQREIFRQPWFNKLHIAAPPIAGGEFCRTLTRHRTRE
jgi:hypothetical protein